MASFKITVGKAIPTAPSRYRVHYKVNGRVCFHGRKKWDDAVAEFEHLLAAGERDVYIHDTRTGDEFRP